MKVITVKLLALCSSIVIAILASLLLFTRLPNRQPNGFVRSWLPAPIPLQQSLVNPAVTHISGASRSCLYFSSTDPRWVLITDTALRLTDTLFFEIQPATTWKQPNISIDSPLVYMYSGNESYFIRGYINTSTLQVNALHTPLFTRMAQVSPELLIVRGIDSTRTHLVFKQLNTHTGQVMKEASIVESGRDAGFATDGFLHYDKASQRLVYIQFYQNRFFCLDTNLTLQYTGNTIDTTFTNTATIKLLQKGNDIKLMPSTPRLMVNNNSTVANGYLYVLSGLRADNETLSDFNQNSTVDVYAIANGKYKGSFYIPKLAGKKMTDWYIRGQLLVTLYKEGEVATFHLPATDGDITSTSTSLSSKCNSNP